MPLHTIASVTMNQPLNEIQLSQAN